MSLAPDDRRNDAQPTHTIGFALTPRFSAAPFFSAVDALRLANEATGRRLYSWRLYSQDGQPVESSAGIAVGVDGAYADIGPMPQVIVCGGADIQNSDQSVLIAKLRKLAFYGVTIGALCTGAHVLARAGLLDGYRCTIHWEIQDAFREEFPDLNVTQELFEIDRNRITCAGGTAAIDMMLSFIAQKNGPDIAAAVTDALIHHRMREPGERQRMDLRSRVGVAHPKILAAVARMEKHLEEPLAAADLARESGLSARQLERLFRTHLGESPARYYLNLRLAHARRLLAQSSMPILSIALACGFVSASHFTKCYGEHFGRTPSQERKRRPAPEPDSLSA